ncbi:MAG: lysophospholipid acyltransferase family protein [Caulobacterales bacterium]
MFFKTQSNFLRQAQWRLEALGWDAISAIMRRLPIDAASAFGGALAKVIGPLTSVHRTVLRNVRLAYPDWDDAARNQLAHAQWENVGRVLFEFFMMDRIIADKSRIEFVNLDRLEAVREGGRGAVFISGHFSNWEVMPAAGLAAGVEGILAYRAANNPYIDARINESRRRYGVRLFAPKGLEGGREVLSALSRGLSVAILNDQRYDPGIMAPFFGRLTPTQHAAVRFAMRFEAPLIPASVQRLDGARFRITLHDPIELTRTNCKVADTEAGVRRINQFLEDRVRESPWEWWWVHRRFPSETYAELAAQGY